MGLTVLLLFGASGSSHDVSAHVILGSKSLHLRLTEAESVVRARVVDANAIFVSEDGSTRRGLVEIEVLEELKGKVGAKRIRFAQDGHAVAHYENGQVALFFLQPIAKSLELRTLAVDGGPTHFSSQEHDEEFVLAAPTGEILLSAARKLAKSESAATVDERVALIREATLSLLLSGDSQLGTSALAGLVLSPQAELVVAADVPKLERLLADSKQSIGFRAGLIAELDRRGLIDGSSHWLRLLETADPTDLAPAIRVASVHPSKSVTEFLLRLLNDPEASTENRAEAAIALGVSNRVSAIGALASAVANGELRLRNAAIRGLGRIHDPAARVALEHAAETNSNAATRQRAEAEIRAVDARNERARSR